jgi:hypothetical protein
MSYNCLWIAVEIAFFKDARLSGCHDAISGSEQETLYEVDSKICAQYYAFYSHFSHFGQTIDF